MPSPYWRDDFEAIGDASLAGVPFQIESVQTTNGRRKAVQRFPGTDFVRGQDLGPGDEEITVDGYIVGTGYHLVLARLKAVFDVADDKVLIDPLRGTVTVTIDGKLKVTQKPRTEGGKCHFSFSCIIVPPATSSSSASPNLANLSALGASILRSTATPALASQLTQLSSALPNAALVSNVSKLQTALSSAYQAVQGAITIANDLASQIDSLASDVAFAIESPTAIMNQIGGIVSQLASAPMKVATAGRTLVNTLSDGQRVAAMLGIAEFMRSSDGPNLPVLPERALADVPDEDSSPTEAALHVGYAITAIVRVELIATMLEQLAVRLPESTAQAREAQASAVATPIRCSSP
jgi:prophage DNA circulation protein